MRKKIFVVGLALAVLLQLAVLSSSAFADTDVRGNIIKKAMLQGVSECANKSNTNFAFKDSIKGTDVPTMANPAYILDSSINGFWVAASDIFKALDDHYPMPSNHEKPAFDYAEYSLLAPYNSRADYYSCASIIGGIGDTKGNKVSSIYDRTGKGKFSSSSSVAEKENWLVQYGGYEKSGGSSSDSSTSDSNTECFNFKASIGYYDDNSQVQLHEGKFATSQSYCVVLGADKKATGGSVTLNGTGGEFDYIFIYFYQDHSYFQHAPTPPYFDGESFVFPLVGAWPNDYTEHDYIYVNVKGRTAEDIKKDIRDALTRMVAQLYKYPKSDDRGDRIGINCSTPWSEDYAKTLCLQDVYDGYKNTKWWAVFAGGESTEVFDDDSSGSSTYESTATYNFSDDRWKIVKALTGTSSSFEAQKASYLTDSEKIMLYEIYLVDVLGAKVSCKTTNADSGITFFDYGNTKADANCSVTYQGATDTAFNGVKPIDISSSMGTGSYTNIIYYTFEEDYTVTYAEIKDYLHNLSPDFVLDFPSVVKSEYYDTNMNDPEELNEKEREVTEELERTCYDSAGSANWIVCPIIDNGSSASTAMYSFIENLLQTNTSIFRLDNRNDRENDANGTFVAWGKFRDYANIAFIIVFVIVILSQVTGMGIDNYGVKKILPKLILGALLVNISYFVCQIAVDSGNLVGGGIKGLFNNIIQGIGLDNMQLKPAFDGINAGKNVIIGTAAGILAAIIGAAWYFSGGGIVVPILLGVIGIVIGIIFLLVLLAVRQGLAVILTVASPLAFIAYMLPNTRSLFNRWLKLFAGTLLAYPICSAVVYGGQMVSNIIIVSAANGSGLVTNFALLLTAGILSIAPVFFIPTLITKSMGGIATVANGLKARATSLGKGAFDRSNTAKNLRYAADSRKDVHRMRSANRKISAIENDKGLFRQARKKLGLGMSKSDAGMLRAAQNTKSEIEKKDYDLYSGMAKRLDQKHLVEMAKSAFDGGGYDDAKYRAAMDQLAATGNEPEMWNVMAAVSGNTHAMNTEQLEKFKSANAGLGTLGKGFTKVVGKNGSMSLADALSRVDSHGEIFMGKAFKDMGADALAKMNKDEMEFLANKYNGKLEDLFTAEQIAAAAATHTSGKAGENFNKLLRKVGNIDTVKNAVSPEQWAKFSQSTLGALRYTNTENETMAQQIVNSDGGGQLINTVSGQIQKDALKDAMKNKGPLEVKITQPPSPPPPPAPPTP